VFSKAFTSLLSKHYNKFITFFVVIRKLIDSFAAFSLSEASKLSGFLAHDLFSKQAKNHRDTRYFVAAVQRDRFILEIPILFRFAENAIKS